MKKQLLLFLTMIACACGMNQAAAESYEYTFTVTEGSSALLRDVTFSDTPLPGGTTTTLDLQGDAYYIVAAEGHELAFVTRAGIEQPIEFFNALGNYVLVLGKEPATFVITTRTTLPQPEPVEDTSFTVTGEGSATLAQLSDGSEIVGVMALTPGNDATYTLAEGTTYYIVADEGYELTTVTADGAPVAINQPDERFIATYAELTGHPEAVSLEINKTIVGGITAITGNDTAPVKYYDLQGRPVTNPASGAMYIRVSGNQSGLVRAN